MQRFLVVLTGAALCAAAAAPAAAQGVTGLRTVRFGVQGGLTLPTGDDADFVDNGFTVGGTVDWRLINRPFGLRLDVGYHRFGLSDEFAEFGVDGNFSIVAGTGAVVLSIPTTGALRPYLLAGAGAYHGRVSIELPDIFGGDCEFDDEVVVSRRPGASRVAPSSAAAPSRGAAPAASLAQVTCTESETRFGLHGGAGLAFPLGGLEAYVEARYHSIFTEESNTNVVPLVFGLRF